MGLFNFWKKWQESWEEPEEKPPVLRYNEVQLIAKTGYNLNSITYKGVTVAVAVYYKGQIGFTKLVIDVMNPESMELYGRKEYPEKAYKPKLVAEAIEEVMEKYFKAKQMEKDRERKMESVGKDLDWYLQRRLPK